MGANYGNLGVGTTTSSVSTPTQLPLSGVTGISGRFAVRRDGTVWTWGSGSDAEMGTDWSTTGTIPFPIQVPRLTNVVTVAAGGDTGYALRSDGTMWSWGSNDPGMLGNGTTMALSRVPVRVAGLTDVTAIGAGNQHGYAVLSDGTVRSWGWAAEGALGDGSHCYCSANAPVTVANITSAVAVNYGRVLDADGLVWIWGGYRTPYHLGFPRKVSALGKDAQLLVPSP